jgi:hypothetical protein
MIRSARIVLECAGLPALSQRGQVTALQAGERKFTELNPARLVKSSLRHLHPDLGRARISVNPKEKALQ